MRSRRFAIVAPNFHPRTCGIGDHSLRLAAELRRRGHSAKVYSRTPVAPHPEDPTVPIKGVEGRLPVSIAHGIRQAVVADRPTDVILQYAPHMWGAWRFGSPAAPFLLRGLRATGIRVTVIAHELFIELDARPDLMLGAALQRAQIVAVARLSDRFFVTTDTRARELVPYWRLAGLARLPEVLRIGPNAMPVTTDRRFGRRVGVFSTFATNKRFDVVLDAFEEIGRRWTDSELVIIGDVGGRSDRRAGAVLESVARHPFRDRIRMTGKIRLPEVATEIAALDVYLFPMTTGANTRSGTLPVALGSGLPVVAVSGVETDASLFRDGENLIFAPRLTAAAFAEAVGRIFTDRELAARLSRGARALYDATLTWAHTGDKLEADA